MKKIFLAFALMTLTAPAFASDNYGCEVYETYALADNVSCDQYCTEERGPMYQTSEQYYDGVPFSLVYASQSVAYSFNVDAKGSLNVGLSYTQPNGLAFSYVMGGSFNYYAEHTYGLTINEQFDKGDLISVRLTCGPR